MDIFISKINVYLTQKSKFLSWFFLVLVVDYLFLFSLETILPGFVTAVFNLNFLLLAVVMIWCILMLVIRKERQKVSVNYSFFMFILVGMFILIGISLVFVLYKADFLESLVYLVFTFVSGWFLYHYLK